MVAFEIAQQLLTLRQEVGLLALFDSEQTASSRTWSWRTRMLNRLHGHFFRLRPLVLGPDRWAAASTICRAKVLKLLFHLHGMFGHTIPAALAGAASTEDRHVFARDRYQPKLYRGRVTLFRARIRPDFEAYDYELGWKQLAQGGVEVHEVPGDHHTMSQEPNVAVLAEEFRRCLEGAYARSKEYRYR
jgi:thioesterase domain-containing protein